MKRALALLLPVAAAAALFLAAGAARADMCLGGPKPQPPVATEPDAGQAPDAGAGWTTRALPREIGGGFLLAATVSTGWLCFRRKDPGEK